MDYELAKKLKDMGFPSKYKNWECEECGKPYEDSEVGTSCVSCGWNGPRRVDIVFRAPILSELIEACGDKMVALQRGEVFNGPNYEVKKGGWEAVSRWESYNPPEIDESFPFGKGKTPEEAVAKLWIELNK